MKNIRLKKLLIGVAALATFGHINTVSADITISYFPFSLGGKASVDGQPNDAGATDHYQVTCSNSPTNIATTYFGVYIQTNTGAPLVSAQIVYLNLSNYQYTATNTTDPVNGDANFSPIIAIPGGNGTYDIYVNKSGPGQVTYTIGAACVDASVTVTTGMSGAIIQDQ